MQRKQSITCSVLLESSVEDLWPYVADFDLLGAMLQVPALEKTILNQQGTGYICTQIPVQSHVLPQIWVENTSQWVKNCWWQRDRQEYQNSPFMDTCETLQLEPVKQGDNNRSSVRLKYTLTYTARTALLGRILKYIRLPGEIKKIRRVFKEIDSHLCQNKALSSGTVEIVPSTAKISKGFAYLSDRWNKTTVERFAVWYSIVQARYQQTFTIEEVCHCLEFNRRQALEFLTDAQHVGLIACTLQATCTKCSSVQFSADRMLDMPARWTCIVCHNETIRTADSAISIVFSTHRDYPIYSPLSVSPAQASRKTFVHVTMNPGEHIKTHYVPLGDTIDIYLQADTNGNSRIVSEAVHTKALHDLSIEAVSNTVQVHKNTLQDDQTTTLSLVNTEKYVVSFTLVHQNKASHVVTLQDMLLVAGQSMPTEVVDELVYLTAPVSTYASVRLNNLETFYAEFSDLDVEYLLKELLVSIQKSSRTHNGTLVQKSSGTYLLCFQEEVSCLECCLEILENREETVHIGICQGTAIINMDAEQVTYTGLAPVLAQRLMEQATPGRILVDQGLVHRQPDCRSLISGRSVQDKTFDVGPGFEKLSVLEVAL